MLSNPPTHVSKFSWVVYHPKLYIKIYFINLVDACLNWLKATTQRKLKIMPHSQKKKISYLSFLLWLFQHPVDKRICLYLVDQALVIYHCSNPIPKPPSSASKCQLNSHFQFGDYFHVYVLGIHGEVN